MAITTHAAAAPVPDALPTPATIKMGFPVIQAAVYSLEERKRDKTNTGNL